MDKFTTIILAAGGGKRMRSHLPKVLHDLMGRPLIYYILKELFKLKKYIKQVIIVVGYRGQTVEEKIRECFCIKNAGMFGETKIEFVYQSKMLGTANALEVASKNIKHDNVLVVCGDTPLVTAKLFSGFIRSFLRRKLSLSVLTANINKENTLGTILRDKKGRLKAIQEKASRSGAKAGDRQDRSSPEEINSGIYCFKRNPLLSNLCKIKKNKDKGEYFLTDILEIFYKGNYRLDSYFLAESQEVLGVNTRSDLRDAERIMRERILDRLAEIGVKIIDFNTTFIYEGVKIGKNTLIYPFTFIEKDVIIGNNCSLGPFVHLREGTSINDNTHVGNFMELNRAKIGKKVRIKHFGYLGDVLVEDNANIGAGAVVANFDGKTKNKTCIRKGAFIGCDTVLVAPVEIGKGAVTGAGSVVTKEVKPKAVVVGVPARVLKKKRGKGS